MIDKKYNIILADNPWSYNDKMKGHQGAETHYPTLNNDLIADLNVEAIAERDATLFMWATMPLLPEAFETMESWGFKYKTVAFVWVKMTKNEKVVSNLGRWTMGNIEIVLLGTRGKPKRIKNNVKQMIFAERKAHSEKPQEVADRIVELMGDLPRVELFARRENPGWDVIGNEINGEDIRDILPPKSQ